MAQDSKIEWTHHTANLWHGCTKVHAGCDHCYAETLSNRWGRDIWGNDKPRMEIKSVFNDLWKYQQLAEKAGEVHRVFVGSMMDIFEKPMPVIDNKGTRLMDEDVPLWTSDIRAVLFEQISNGYYPNLLFLFLTKRPSNINKYIPESWKTDPPKNVMFGTSPCDQATYDTLLPQLFQVNGLKFLSIEPLLGPIELLKDYPVGKGEVQYGALLDWVIVGGESGHGARPMHPDWVRRLRDQCNTAGVPFFFKQWGEFAYHENYPVPVDDLKSIKHFFEDGQFHLVEKGTPAYKISWFPISVYIGKKEAGRLLDGQLYDEFPVIS